MSNDSKYSLSRRKALLGLGTVGIAGAGAGVGTSALFSDTESFEDNTITAGTQNLIVNAEIVDATTFEGNAGSVSIENTTVDGAEPAVGITVEDIKPGDSFVIAVDPVVTGNPGYLALTGDVTENADNVNTEPEASADGNITNSTATQGTQGELLNYLEITSLGYESGDANNGAPSSSVSITDDDGFPGDFPNSTGNSILLADLLSGLLYRGRDGGTPAGHGAAGDSATRVGGDTSQANVDTNRVTHLVEFTLPVSVGNVVQGDSLTFDLTWSLEQVRNNSEPANASEVDGSAN
ncbi:hypothetical protein EXE42_00830 [Halorubrum sp. SP3]|nr:MULTISPECIES: SipW-dependent-type signal peptide-containing protein [unclassified Halorubrum]TKX56135.1 hypothetical protein EXE42_00830 [Halorubrum sp. SP3]TKX71153.1 hypothetical protein EXE45_02735 [Halorubrum sp. SP9]